jgi:hypothetical protein
MKRLLREPLVHFLALGALLFAIGIARGEPATPSGTRIAITQGHIERLLEGFRMTWNRPPTEDEFRGLMEEFLKEEVLYREALGMGLDQDDQIIRRRLRQKLEFMTADFVGTVEPTDEELQAYLDEHADRYRSDGRLRFVQVFIGSGGADAEARARAVLDRLLADPDQEIGALTDPFLHPLAYPDASEQELRSVYGPDFAQLMMQQPVGTWSGPVPSPFGLHLVRVDTRVEGEAPTLQAARAEVYRDLMFERTREAEQAYFEGLLEQYTVTVEWPEGMDAIDVPGVAR